jgi:hypothetical protein
MLKKWLDGKIEDVPKNGYLNVNGEKHLVLNIQNQPIEVLNANGIYEYIETERPAITEKEMCSSTYSLCGNVIQKVYEVHKINLNEL